MRWQERGKESEVVRKRGGKLFVCHVAVYLSALEPLTLFWD